MLQADDDDSHEGSVLLIGSPVKRHSQDVEEGDQESQ